MKSHTFFLFFFLFLLIGSPLIAAEETETNPSFQFNRQINLIRACSNTGFFCDSNFVCNITISYPLNGAILINNQRMGDQGSFRNITINQTANNILGTLKAIQSCDNGTAAGLQTFDIDITADGNPFQAFPNEFFFIIISILLVALGLFNERLRLFKYMGGLLMMVTGVITLYPGYNFINYSTLLGLAIGSILIGLGFYFLIEDSFSRDKQEDHYDQRSEFIDEE